MTDHPCICSGPGHCPRYAKLMTPHWHELCQTREDYRRLWDSQAGTQCVYLGKETPQRAKCQTCGPDIEVKVFECQRHERCTIGSNTEALASCGDCKERLLRDNRRFAAYWQDPLKLYDRHKLENSALRGILAGRSVFLACGGPSAKELPIEQLKRRGSWTMAINNSAGYFPCQAFVCSDPPSKFSHSVWTDPAIMKFIPRPKMDKKRSGLRRKLPKEQWQPCDACGQTGRANKNGKDKACDKCSGIGVIQFEQYRLRADQCPNLWGFSRRSWMAIDDTFFLDESAAWGNQDAGVHRTGERKCAMTMLLGMRLLRYLGAKRVFLLGVDFGMDASRGPTGNYVFGEQRNADAIASNNQHFEIVNDWLCRLQEQGVFKRFGISFFNCNQYSGLRAFPYVPFADAILDVVGDVEETPDLSNWYMK